MSLSDDLSKAEKKAEAAIAADEVQFNSDDKVIGASLPMCASAWGRDDWDAWLRLKGTDPETVTYTFGVTSNPSGGYWNKLLSVKDRPLSGEEFAPLWPVIQPAAPIEVKVTVPAEKPARSGMKLSLKCADTQIGFRVLPDGTLDPFHDWAAMNLFIEVCRMEQPESIVILGDFLDLPGQGKYAQEAGFARTTQPSLDDGHKFLALLRAVCPLSEIILIEGNHDKRMQSFIELNALAAFGLRKANMPESWPVMSIQNLLRLDELKVTYMDAYPAATHWDDKLTRNIHGTKANSKGSTMSMYSSDLPHINTWAGHSHRAEIIYKTVLGGHGEAIESYSANPGCLCRTEGSVPSVNGALHADGTTAKVIENWQQGFGSLLFNEEGVAWPQVHRIKNGRTVYNGKIYEATA